MSDVIIHAEGLGKKYIIGHETQRESYTALRDVIARGAQNFLRKARDMVHGRPIIEGDELEEVWALRDVNFEVGRGEVVGIIGRNGAGKSTLLKILSRITEPSEGRISIRGRVASLLEVGTGFHPELSGRENIFLNGAILGMRRVEIRRKFDEIVTFAEVEKFLDTPVKRYSSGMYIRLAFAVAAHLEPDILVVDEVLAVGDVAFQKKCLGKMQDVAEKEGRTVLFVSHNMGAIKRLTRRGVLLEQGRIKADASVQEAVELYMKQASQGLDRGVFLRGTNSAKDQPFHVYRVTTRSEATGEPSQRFDCDQAFFVCAEFLATRKMPGLYAYIVLQRLDGTVIYEGDSRDGGDNPLDSLEAGNGTLVIRVPPRILGPGSYQVYLSLASNSDPAGHDVDIPGIVGEISLDDSTTLRGNARNGYLSTIFGWEISADAQREEAFAQPHE